MLNVRRQQNKKRNWCASGFGTIAFASELRGRCDENDNWRIVRGSPRTNTDDGRTRARRRRVVRELVVPIAPEHVDYPGPDGARRRIQPAWDGPGGAAIQPIVGFLPCGGHADT